MKRKSVIKADKLKTRSGKSVIRNHPFLIGLVFLIGMICLLTSGVQSANQDERIENTRAALTEWVQTQRIISKEKHDLVLAKQVLNERIELVQREIESLREKVGGTENSIAEADKKRTEMLAENEKLKQASASLGEILLTLENGIQGLLPRLPEPIRERVKPLSQRLPEDPEQTKLSTAERFQNIVGILNEVDKFNRQITTTSEVRTLPHGNSVEVAAVYIGISQGYYASANGVVAGVGTATEKGWEWKPANEAADKILDVIAILKNEKVASFIQVPVEIQ